MTQQAIKLNRAEFAGNEWDCGYAFGLSGESLAHCQAVLELELNRPLTDHERELVGQGFASGRIEFGAKSLTSGQSVCQVNADDEIPL